MPTIKVLPPVLANRIAAGEVVERPASIVKELVENAIDAGSTSIFAAIEDGGVSSIVVTDNGCGIPEDQCENAFLRHATSKVSSADDLDCIETLGFRGEALASIAAVSCTTMTTRTHGGGTGFSVCMDSGDVRFRKELMSPAGTTIRVENLFAKVPARLRFLKSARIEAGYCADLMSRIMLAHPEISFRYSQDGKSVYETSGNGSLKEVIYALYGKNIFNHIIPVDYDDGYCKIYGFIGTQEVSHANRSLQSFFVNGRYIRSQLLSNSVENAFLTKIMVGRFPFAVLNITLSPKEVDVNIHPAKTQVRFADENRIADIVTLSCTNALQTKTIIPQVAIKNTAQVSKENAAGATTITDVDTLPHNAEKYPPAENEVIKDDSQSKGSQGSIGTHLYKEFLKAGAIPSEKSVLKDVASDFVYSSFSSQKQQNGQPVFQAQNAKDADFNPKDSLMRNRSEQAALPIQNSYKLIGCLFNAYWLMEYGEALYIIDQHAACERRLYEKFIAEEKPCGSQILLSAASLPVTPIEQNVLEKYKTELEKIGFRFAVRETASVAIEAVPVINGSQFSPAFILEAASILEKNAKAASRDFAYKALVSASCKKAIKAGDIITETEMRALIDSFLEEGIPLTCPHGRPVVVSLSKTEIEKNFKRIV